MSYQCFSLSVRRWTRYLCCWLLCFILAMYISRLWQMPIQRSLLTYSCWREVSVTSTWCHQHMWDWKEWKYFPTTISMGMENAHMHVHSWGQCFSGLSPASLIIQLIHVFLWPLTLERRWTNDISSWMGKSPPLSWRCDVTAGNVSGGILGCCRLCSLLIGSARKSADD